MPRLLDLGGRARSIVFGETEDGRGIESWPNRRENTGLDGVLSLTPPLTDTLSRRQNGNGAQANGVGIGHAKGWRLAEEAMGIDWMDRKELTQAVPPVYTRHIGHQLMGYLLGRQEPWEEPLSTVAACC